MTSDGKHIIDLLAGRLKEGSDNELKARRALARMLKTSLPLDQGVRSILADLIDPDCDINRRIRFTRRRKGKPSNAAAEKLIAEFIWNRRRGGMKMKPVVSAATTKFGLQEKRILAVWKVWQPILQRLKRIDLDGNPVNPFAAVQHNRD
jgi:hypothetical protein